MDAKIQSFYGQWLEKYILILTLHKEESYHREAIPFKSKSILVKCPPYHDWFSSVNQEKGWHLI